MTRYGAYLKSKSPDPFSVWLRAQFQAFCTESKIDVRPDTRRTHGVVHETEAEKLAALHAEHADAFDLWLQGPEPEPK